MVIGGFAAFLVAGGAFVLVEQRVGAPMLPLGVFSSATFSAATLVGLLINLGFYGELFVMSLYLQTLRGFTPLLAGVALVPEAMMAIVGSAASGRVMARTGPRLPMLCGLCVGGAGLLGLIAVGEHTSYGVLVVPFMAAGLGMSFTMPAATAAVMEAAPHERGGLASGTLNAARQVGGVIGVALLGSLVAHRAPVAVRGSEDRTSVALLGSLVAHRASFVPGLRVGMAVAGSAFLLGAALTALGVERGRAARPGTAPTSANK